MKNIDLKVYPTVQDYKNKTNMTTFIISTYLKDLERHAITLGNLSGHITSYNGSLFYKRFVKMFFDRSLNISSDYKNSETTLKTMYSFFMGMILTKQVAEKKYRINNLFHLKDNLVNYQEINGKKHPDFFGQNSHRQPYLFEAKGRYSRLISRTSTQNGRKVEIDEVKDQLLNINILDITGSLLYSNTNINKHIVLSKFSPDFEMYDIDPPSENNKGANDIIIDEAKLLKNYYSNIIYLLDEGGGDLFTKNIKGLDYKVKKIENRFVGIEENVYLNLKKLQFLDLEVVGEEKKQQSINNEVLKKHYKIVESFELYSDENMSIGLDGIVLYKR